MSWLLRISPSCSYIQSDEGFARAGYSSDKANGLPLAFPGRINEFFDATGGESQIMRTGVDLDHLHPNCSQRVTTNCFPEQQPFNGNLLQVMPWPIFQGFTEIDLRAIYEYLSAVPCISGPSTGVLHNDCV